MDNLLDRLRTDPVGINSPLELAEARHGIVDYALARSVIFGSLYQIQKYGKLLAEALASLERGDGSTTYTASGQRMIFDMLLTCSSIPGAPELLTLGYDTAAAIACGDTDGRNETLADLRAFYEELAQTSSFGELFLPHAMCSYVRWSFYFIL